MVSNCADLTLSCFLYLTVRLPIWHYNYRLQKRQFALRTASGQYYKGTVWSWSTRDVM